MDTTNEVDARLEKRFDRMRDSIKTMNGTIITFLLFVYTASAQAGDSGPKLKTYIFSSTALLAMLSYIPGQIALSWTAVSERYANRTPILLHKIQLVFFGILVLNVVIVFGVWFFNQD